MKLGYGTIARRRAGQAQIQVPAPNDWLVWWVCLWVWVWTHASTGSHTGQRRLMKSALAVRCALYSVQGTLFSVPRISALQTLSCTCDGAVACFFFRRCENPEFILEKHEKTSCSLLRRCGCSTCNRCEKESCHFTVLN